MSANITDTEDQIRGQLMLDFKAPVLDHAGTPVTLGNISWAAKAKSGLAIVLGRIKIGRRRKGWYARAQQYWIPRPGIGGEVVPVC